MFNKKYILILILLIVGICAISAVSASDDVADTIASDISNDVVTSDGADADELKANLEENSVEKTEEVDDGEKLSANDEESVLTADQTKEMVSSLPSSFYSVSFKYDEISIESNKAGRIDVYINPCTYMDEAYHYNYLVMDKNANVVYKSPDLKATTASKGYYYWNIPAKSIAPGAYVIAAVNTYDAGILDTAVLKVSGTAVITADNYNSNYMSGAVMKGRITDQVTGKPISGMDVKVVFTNGRTSVTKYYSPNANGDFSFVPPVGVGTWTVTFSSSQSYVSATPIQRTATIKKSSVSVKAKKVVEYKGFKIKLKATVKSNGKNVNEGKVAFKINGKTYKVNVKNGVATKKIKLKKIKKYKYTAKYLGNANLYKSKKASKANAIMKKRQKVKITFKKPVVYTGQVKKIVIKIKSRGKYVKGGWLKIKNSRGVEKVKVKKGKVTLYLYGRLSEHYKGTNGIDKFYKKTVTHKYWLKYIPASHKYYAKKVNYKGVSKFKCDLCGKKSTHNHYTYGYFVRYTYKIVVS
jgi:hypothetical protein